MHYFAWGMSSFQLVTLCKHVLTRVVGQRDAGNISKYLVHKWLDLVLSVRHQGRHLGHKVFHGLLANLLETVVLHKRLEVLSEILVVKLENSRGVKICRKQDNKEIYESIGPIYSNVVAIQMDRPRYTTLSFTAYVLKYILELVVNHK